MQKMLNQIVDFKQKKFVTHID